MGYKNKNDKKGERKLGQEAVRKMINAVGYDPQQTLALAQSNIENFRKIDDADDKTFISFMKDLRENYPEVYPVFWWWRFAEEDAGYGKEDDCDTGESRYRAFMITQFLAAPFSEEWEEDRQALKDGVSPWITEQQIVDGFDHKSIKQWFWAWHDRDVYTEKDEITDRTGRVRAGDRKFKHAHVICNRCQHASSLMKAGPGRSTLALKTSVAKWYQRGAMVLSARPSFGRNALCMTPRIIFGAFRRREG